MHRSFIQDYAHRHACRSFIQDYAHRHAVDHSYKYAHRHAVDHSYKTMHIDMLVVGSTACMHIVLYDMYCMSRSFIQDYAHRHACR